MMEVSPRNIDILQQQRNLDATTTSSSNESMNNNTLLQQQHQKSKNEKAMQIISPMVVLDEALEHASSSCDERTMKLNCRSNDILKSGKL